MKLTHQCNLHIYLSNITVTTYHQLLRGRQLPETELNSFQAQDNCNNITIILTIWT